MAHLLVLVAAVGGPVRLVSMLVVVRQFLGVMVGEVQPLLFLELLLFMLVVGVAGLGLLVI
jgi:hypothetical protein